MSNHAKNSSFEAKFDDSNILTLTDSDATQTNNNTSTNVVSLENYYLLKNKGLTKIKKYDSTTIGDNGGSIDGSTEYLEYLLNAAAQREKFIKYINEFSGHYDESETKSVPLDLYDGIIEKIIATNILMNNTQIEKDENQMDDGYKQLIRRLDEDSRERESRLSAEMKEREERYERRSKEVEDRLIHLYEDSINKITAQLNNQEKLLDSKLDLFNTKVEHIENQVNELHSRTRFWVNLIVPVIVAIGVGIATIFFAN